MRRQRVGVTLILTTVGRAAILCLAVASTLAFSLYVKRRDATKSDAVRQN
jgi:hypothetical protein